MWPPRCSATLLRLSVPLLQLSVPLLRLSVPRRYTCGILEGNLLPPAPPKREWRELMEDLSAISCECVRNVLHDVATWPATVQHAALCCNTLCCEPMANATAISHEYRHTRRRGWDAPHAAALAHARRRWQRQSNQESIPLHCRDAMRCNAMQCDAMRCNAMQALPQHAGQRQGRQPLCTVRPGCSLPRQQPSRGPLPSWAQSIPSLRRVVSPPPAVHRLRPTRVLARAGLRSVADESVRARAGGPRNELS